MKLPNTITLTNTFHNTKIRIHYKHWMCVTDHDTTWAYIQYRARDPKYFNRSGMKELEKRIKKKLCGSKDCTCGTVRD